MEGGCSVVNLSQEYLWMIFGQLIDYRVDPNSFATLIRALRSSKICDGLASIQAEPIKVSIGERWLYVSLNRLEMMSGYVGFRRSNCHTLSLDIFDIWLEMLIVASSQNLEGQALVDLLYGYISQIGGAYTLDQGLYREFEIAVQFLLHELVSVS